MFGISFDILFAVFVIGGAIFRFLSSSPGQRKERGCLVMITVFMFILYFLLLPPEKEETKLENISVPAYIK